MTADWSGLRVPEKPKSSVAADWQLLSLKILGKSKQSICHNSHRPCSSLNKKMSRSHLLLLSSSLLLLVPFVLILRSYLVFNGRLTSNPIFDTHNNASQTMLNAEPNTLQEEIRRHDPEVSVVGSSGSKFLRNAPSLQYTPLNMTREGRIKWFQDNLPRFKDLHSDSISAQFSARVKAFFKPCKLRFYNIWISQIESFGYREQLSMESLFKWNPTCCLLIISRTMDSEAGEQILRPFTSRGFRVMAAAPDLRHLFEKTPAEEWLRKIVSGDIDPGEVPFAQNLSNLLRLAVLYKYGGIYVDADVILLRSFSNLKNTIGAQSADPQTGQWIQLNSAVLAFDKRHPLLLKFIQEFALTFDGNIWGHNGPYLLTRVVSSLANKTHYDFKVMPPIAFYPVGWKDIASYFINPSEEGQVKWRSAKIIQLEREAYAIHLWNKLSRGLTVEEGSIMHHIFNISCIFCLSGQGAS